MIKKQLTLPIPNDKLFKNYFRENLKVLIGGTNSKPILFSGKYKHRTDQLYFTFSTIRPILSKGTSVTICDHINFKKEEIGCFFDFSEAVHNRKFYFVGYPDDYLHNGDVRGHIRLEYNLGIPALFFSDDKNKYLTEEIKQKLFYLDEVF